MKTLVESIFDDEQTHINNSGPKLSNIKNDKDLKNWLKYYDLELSIRDAKRIYSEFFDHPATVLGASTGYSTTFREFWYTIHSDFMKMSILKVEFILDGHVCNLTITAPKSYKRYPFYTKLIDVIEKEGFQKDIFYIIKDRDTITLNYKKKI